MANKKGQPTLVSFLASPVVASVTKTPLFGGPYMLLYDFFKVVSALHQVGAILGRARRNNLNILAKLLVVRGTEVNEVNKLIELSQKDVRKRLEEFRNEFGREPDTFDEFILSRAIEGALSSEDIDLTPTEAREAYARGDKKVKKLFNEKVALEMTEPRIKIFLVEGIMFGASFPELTERMYRKACKADKNEMDTWINTWAQGLTIPKELTVMDLEEAEDELLQMVAAYTSEYYPELLDPLDLRGYLKV